MKKYILNFIKIILFQILFGVLSLILYLFWYFLTEPLISFTVPIISVILTIASLILYYYFVPKFLVKSNIKLFCILNTLFFLIVTIISSSLNFIESDLVGSIVITLQQTSYFATEINENNNATLYLIIFALENLLKLLCLILGAIKINKTK